MNLELHVKKHLTDLLNSNFADRSVEIVHAGVYNEHDFATRALSFEISTVELTELEETYIVTGKISCLMGNHERGKEYFRLLRMNINCTSSMVEYEYFPEYDSVLSSIDFRVEITDTEAIKPKQMIKSFFIEEIGAVKIQE